MIPAHFKCKEYNELMKRAHNFKPNSIVVQAHDQKMFALGDCKPTDKQWVESSHPKAPEKFSTSIEVYPEIEDMFVIMEGEVVNLTVDFIIA